MLVGRRSTLPSSLAGTDRFCVVGRWLLVVRWTFSSVGLACVQHLVDVPVQYTYKLQDVTGYEIDERLEVAALTEEDGAVRILMQYN